MLMKSSPALGKDVARRYTHSHRIHAARLCITQRFAKDFDMFDFARTHTHTRAGARIILLAQTLTHTVKIFAVRPITQIL